MDSYLKHYINGKWVDSIGGKRHEVISPSTEEPCTEITLGTQADVDRERIGVIGGYHYTAVEPLWQGQRATRVNQPRLPLLMRALQTGMVDVVINSELEMSAWARANPAQATNLRLHPLVVSVMPTRCAVSPGSRYSESRLDQAIGEMEQNGSIRRILDRYEWKNR